MRSLRRSLNSKDSTNGPPISPPVALPPLHKPSSAILPPKKVIRALQPYRPQAAQELGFAKGDFFYVVSEVSGGQGWYEAHNPVSGARGLVPKDCFEEFHKANAVARAVSPNVTTPATTSPRSAPAPPGRSPMTPPSPRHQSFYAMVLHDFTAERTDELDAKTGDPITVVAQSNQEWFVAKPIGKLGRPGLIPASFVELRDPATNRPLPDLAGIIARGELPKVEDWKRAMHEYKQSSISLGVLDDRSASPGLRNTYPSNTPHPPAPPPPPQSMYGLQTPPTMPSRSTAPVEPLPEDRPPTPVSMQDSNLLPPGMLVSAEVVDFHFENDEYWFRINAMYQPEDQPFQPMRQLVLFRVYDDFYDFQIALLDAFPVEAGREIGPPSPRSEGGPSEAEPSRILPYMPGPVPQVDDVVTALRREELDDYLGQLCALREINAEHVLRHPLVTVFFSPKPGDVETKVSAAPVIANPSAPPRHYETEDDQRYREMRDGVGALSLRPNETRLSDASRYDDEGTYGRSNGSDYERERVPSRNDLHTHMRAASTASLSLSRNASPLPQTPDGYRRTDSMPFSDSGQSSHGGVSHPSISASNPQTAFIKIKIFHRRTDDLIAIRVNPRVSHTQLMEKVRERLGDDVQTVSYRSSVNGGFADLRNDHALRDWLDTADKHVLYAL